MYQKRREFPNHKEHLFGAWKRLTCLSRGVSEITRKLKICDAEARRRAFKIGIIYTRL